MIAQPMPPSPEPQHIAVADVSLPAAFSDPRFEELFKLHNSSIKKNLTYLSGDEVLAEEAMLDGFMSLAGPVHWPKVISGAILNPRAFTMKLAENKLRNSLRSYLRTAAHEPVMAMPDDLVDLQSTYSVPWYLSPERSAHVHEIRSLLRVVMPRLYRTKPNQAITVCLRYLDEYEIFEVADMLQAKPSTVRSNLRFGLKSLRELILEFEAEVSMSRQGDQERSIG